jgi:hypothetical protein
MKLHENLLEICPIWWPNMGFVPQAIEFGVKFNFLLKMYAIT